MKNPPSVEVPFIDQMLSLEAAAEWLGIHKRTLLKKCKGRHPVIPGFQISRQEYRFHPRTIIAHMAVEAGVPRETVAASMPYPDFLPKITLPDNL
ncbi:MAG TPA: helix-turn-helix domain-containing protein [Verrucomicrobiae bacterium]|jgi:hypothetical protein